MGIVEKDKIRYDDIRNFWDNDAFKRSVGIVLEFLKIEG